MPIYNSSYSEDYEDIGNFVHENIKKFVIYNSDVLNDLYDILQM